MELFDSGTKRRLPHLVGPRLSWVVVLLAIIFSGLALSSPISADESGNGVANVPAGAESRQAQRLRDAMGGSDVVPAIVVLDREGAELSADDRSTVKTLGQELQQYTVGQAPVFQQFSEDGRAALIGVPLSSTASNDELVTTVEAIRGRLGSQLPEGLRAQVTGGPAFTVDLAGVFDGADTRLLIVTAAVVALLLLLTYRSPWLWLVPLAVVGIADRVAISVVAVGTKVLPFTTDGASVGITSVLVFGAGTNYALLLIARYREELRRHEDRYEAMRIAVDRAAPAILASSGTVVLALLCLGFAESPSSRNIGLGGALGILTAVAYALLVLPAAMTVPGRALFWPFIPRVRRQPVEQTERTGAWWRVATAVTKRPVLVGSAALVFLALLMIPLTGLRTGLSQTEQFRATPESVTGQKTLGEHFPAGFAQPTIVVASTQRAAQVVAAVKGVEGVRSAQPSAEGDGRTSIDVVTSAAPATDEAFSLITQIRSAARSADPGALTGGTDAEALDASASASHDRRLIIPLVLLVVLSVLLALLRSLVAAVVLVLTVVATYAAAMGAAWIAFTNWFDFPALDLTVPLLAFLFLVALGVDYNIFLTTRAKEEAEQSPDDVARGPISLALAVTGGVITSAGILLAAVFAVLGVLPLIVLTQIGVIVGFGVLLDTLLVRSVLVPALVTLLGRWFWWPGHLSRTAEKR